MSAAPPEAFGPYLVYEQLGIGGMAQVHRAELPGIEGFQRSIALKRMLPHVAGNEDMVRAFVREARLASHLRHANVAQTYELGKVEDTYFIAMELVSGPTLRDILRHGAQTIGPMPVPVALNILNQICDALDYAHNLCDEAGAPFGIIHRDVSPSNVIVADGGVVKLIDFGIAKATGAGMQTMSGTIKGKFGYMAPEYLAGRIDARADLFALGVIAHELLTNRPLFSGRDDMDTLNRVTSMEIVPPSRRNPQVPAEIDDIVMTALARDPAERWQQATALRSALTTLTRRLGLEIHNQQMFEWISGAFQHAASSSAGMQSDDLSIEISRQTPTPSAPATLLMDPPTQTPVGTPAFVPAQRGPASYAAELPTTAPGTVPGAALSTDEYRAAVAAYHRRELAVSAVALPAAGDDDVPTTLRPSLPRAALGSIPAPMIPAVTMIDGAVGPRLSTPVPAPAPAPAPALVRAAQGSLAPATAPIRPAAVRAPAPTHGGPYPGQPVVQPVVQPHAASYAGPPQHAAPYAPPVSRPRPPTIAEVEAEAEVARRSAVWAVILVLLAAAVAAATVYFVLPLVT